MTDQPDDDLILAYLRRIDEMLERLIAYVSEIEARYADDKEVVE